MKQVVRKNCPAVFIVVLSYNCCAQTRRCLTSLAELTYSNYQVVVVDNNSLDEVGEIVAAEFPLVVFLQTGENLGYTGGNNRGIEYALAQGANYVLVLNPDTIAINPAFLTAMVEYCEAHREVGIAGPRVFLRNRQEVQNTVLYAPGFWRNLNSWVRYRITPDKFQLSRDQVVDAEVLNGVCVLLRATCLKEIGLFDENIFMYIEDADLDHRARLAGWAVRYLPIDSIVHEQKSEGYHMTSLVSFLLRRNSVYYLCKVGKRFEAWGYAILSLAVLLGRACLTFKLNNFRDYAGFCRKLTLSYRRILFNQKLDGLFGPPFVS